MDIGMTLLGYLLPVIASIITLFLMAGARKLLEKMGIERTEKIDGLIDKYVEVGVTAAEIAARKHLAISGEKMDSEDKKLKAIDAVMAELKQSGLLDVSKEIIVNRIENWLELSGHKPGLDKSEPTKPQPSPLV